MWKNTEIDTRKIDKSQAKPTGMTSKIDTICVFVKCVSSNVKYQREVCVYSLTRADLASILWKNWSVEGVLSQNTNMRAVIVSAVAQLKLIQKDCGVCGEEEDWLRAVASKLKQ